jgi:O-antigen ligase
MASTLRPTPVAPSGLATRTLRGVGSRFQVPTTAGFYFALLYLFDLFSRLPEFTIAFVGNALFQSPLLMTITLAFALVSGHIFEAFRINTGRWLLAYMAWLALSLPFSYWKSASLQSYSYTLRYYLLFVLTVTLVRNMAEVRKAIVCIAFAPIPILIAMRILGAEQGGRLQLSFGSFANSNELASYMIMLAPLTLLVASMRRYNWLLRGTSLVLCLLCLSTASRTGSRGAIFSLAVVILLLFLNYNFQAKLKLVAVLVPMALVLLAFVPQEALLRYVTAFKQQEDLGNSATELQQSALASTESRMALLRQSIQLTVENPIFGVGVGTFSAAAAAMSAEAGQKALWQVSHNAYTQVSSESGVPSLIFYLGACWVFVKQLWRLARQPKWNEIRSPGFYAPSEETRQLALHLLLAFAASATYGMFASTAGEFSFFVLMGLGTTLYRAHETEAQAFRQAALSAAAQPDSPSGAMPPPPAGEPRSLDRRTQIRPVVSNQGEKPVYPPVRRLPRHRSPER